MDIFRLQGTPYSSASTDVRADAFPITGALSLDLSGESVESTGVNHRKGNFADYTRGRYVPGTASLKVRIESGVALMEYLSARGGGSYGSPLAKFTLSVTISELESFPPKLPILWILEGCRISEPKDGFSEDTNALVTEFTIKPTFTTRNGLAIWNRLTGI